MEIMTALMCKVYLLTAPKLTKWESPGHANTKTTGGVTPYGNYFERVISSCYASD
jgi:hypothetical protein